MKHNVLHPSTHPWSFHDSKPQQFIEYFIVDTHHKTLTKTLQARFYVFEDTISPKILLYYAASERLGPIEFKESNKASTPSVLDTISTTKMSPSASYYIQSKCHHTTPTTQHQGQSLKTTLSKTIAWQDHCSTTRVAPLQDHSTSVAPFQNHNSKQCRLLFKYHLSLVGVKDIFTLENSISISLLIQLATCKECISFT